MNRINFLPPWVETNLQPAFYDLESGTSLQQTARMYNKVNQLVRSVNEQNETIADYIQRFIDLKDYVDDYFDNLDVQEEINNKLDALVEDGTMNEIINQEIFGSINDRLDLLDQKKYIFIGDSYCEGYTPDGNVTSWATLLKNKMGLTSSNCTIAYHGGWGFGYPNKWFSTILDGLTADSTVTDIVVCGGYNDKQCTYNEINAGIADFVRVRDEKFPNAHIHVGFIGATAFPWSRSPFKSKIIDYIRSANQYENCSYLGNVEYSLLRLYECFASDGYHPNDLGQRLISDNLHQALITGSADCKFPYFSMAVSPASTWTGSSNLSFIGCEVENGTTYIEYTNQAPINLTNSNQSSLVCDGQHWLEVGEITAGFVCGTTYKNVVVPVNVVMRHSADSSAKWGSFTGQLRFEDKKVELAIVAGHESSGYLSLTGITNIQIFPFSGAFDSLFC